MATFLQVAKGHPGPPIVGAVAGFLVGGPLGAAVGGAAGVIFAVFGGFAGLKKLVPSTFHGESDPFDLSVFGDDSDQGLQGDLSGSGNDAQAAIDSGDPYAIGQNLTDGGVDDSGMSDADDSPVDDDSGTDQSMYDSGAVVVVQDDDGGDSGASQLDSGAYNQSDSDDSAEDDTYDGGGGGGSGGGSGSGSSGGGASDSGGGGTAAGPTTTPPGASTGKTPLATKTGAPIPTGVPHVGTGVPGVTGVKKLVPIHMGVPTVAPKKVVPIHYGAPTGAVVMRPNAVVIKTGGTSPPRTAPPVRKPVPVTPQHNVPVKTIMHSMFKK